MHRLWLETVGGRLETRLSYANTIVWNTFPLPSLSDRRKADLEEHWWAIDEARDPAFRDVARLRLIQHLSQEEGINLNGIRRILELEAAAERMREELAETQRLLAEARAHRAGVPRVFTAEATGAVHLGRQPRRQLALPGR